MTFDWKLLTLLFSLLVLINLIILIWTFFVKIRAKRKYRQGEKYRDRIEDLINGKEDKLTAFGRRERIDFLTALQKWSKSFQFPENRISIIESFVKDWDISSSVKAKLASPFLHSRAEGLLLVELLPFDEMMFLLEKTVQRERNMLLKLKMIEILCSLNLRHSLEIIIGSMRGASEIYIEKIINLLSPYSLQLTGWAGDNRNSADPLYRRIVMIAALEGREDWIFPHLQKEIRSDNREIRLAAADLLFRRFSSEISPPDFFESTDEEIRKLAVITQIRNTAPGNPALYSGYFRNPQIRQFTIDALSVEIAAQPALVARTFQLYCEAQDRDVKQAWAEVLSDRLGYYLFRLGREDLKGIGDLIDDVIALGRYSRIVNFLNSNRNQHLERKLRDILIPHLHKDLSFRRYCRLYLSRQLQERWRIPDSGREISEPKFLLKKKDRAFLGTLMTAVLLLPLFTFVLFNGSDIPYYRSGEVMIAFVFHYHYLFAFYNISVNAVYFILMMMSWAVINKQQTLWDLLDRKFLFTPGILPSVSILAPAFNEEKTIIQNVYSLLSLDYSEFEVIVIDDGSTDRTAEFLINHFQMELVEQPSGESIPSAPVRGVYKSRLYPGLLFITKMNGGKADALNAGINFAGGSYICSIDADSILEPDSLQKIMVRTLVSSRETVAIGGNVLPSNGTVVKNGCIREIHLASNKYARIQTVEYLRSFISNRLGWSGLNSLLVISGAFGVFKRNRILEIGGYLTGKGKQRKDTVGEDMEVVVHLYEHMKDRGTEFKIDYAYNANCWTEVPEDLGSLVKQRDRWHRGLIEVMIYHKRLLFKGKYGSVGLLAFPYFYIFELLGPFLETAGYFFLIIPFFLGLLDNQIILFMFSIAVVLGILISVISLFLAEKGVLYFKGRDFLRIIGTAFAENFGYRQFISMLRPISYFNYVFRSRDKGWEKLNRLGFREVPAGED